ncbi:2-C-methyl-D-erythritol 4-phosphate cytidylyltransferase, partial [Candidatus Peregrinibacteria bacterium]|nr:2-C-methyl-D-erythritol 4-phosphate cytidylyltransferase [Candidatus Peregrinibacteria bacterium]
MNHVIILAAGQGQRMKNKKDKLLLEAGGKPLIYYSLMAFNDHPEISGVTLVVNKQNSAALQKVVKTYFFPKVNKFVQGGLSRYESFIAGFKALGDKIGKNDIVLVHNGANPLVSEDEISAAIKKAEETGAAIVGHKVVDTIKEIDKGLIKKTHDRSLLFAAQTPQAAKYGLLKKAFDHAVKKKLEPTDESMLLEAIGQKVSIIEASENNFKVTTAGDFVKLQAILGDLPEDFRIGIGQDSHMFDEKEKGLTLGGILLNEERKLQANSDGDVILHAIFNAISQALGDHSLGFYADEMCEKGVKDSKKYLDPLLKKMKAAKFKLNSLG